MPTDTDTNALVAYGGVETTFNSIKGWGIRINGEWLFFPYTGYYSSSEELILDSGTYGYYWSGTDYDATNAYYMHVHSGYSYGLLSWGAKSYAISVRCVKSAS